MTQRGKVFNIADIVKRPPSAVWLRSPKCGYGGGTTSRKPTDTFVIYVPFWRDYAATFGAALDSRLNLSESSKVAADLTGCVTDALLQH